MSEVGPSKRQQQQQSGSTTILMQGFHWNSWSYNNPNWYVTLANNAADMKALGITHVWFPPASDSDSTQGYLPRQLNNFNSSYGSQVDLQDTINSFADQGIQSVADVVINHRVGTTNAYDFTYPA
jgi:alpha-amylase